MTAAWPRRGALTALFFVCSGGLAFGCGGADGAFDDDTDDNRTEAIDGVSGMGGAGATTGAGTPGTCTPGAIVSCYSGPPGTDGVGLCEAGVQTCNDQGTAWSACVGEVVPIAETCTTPGDDDCNGFANDAGADCSCTPGSTIACYTGPASTQGQGICQDGVQTCRADGSGYEPCSGEQLPLEEDCATATIDEDCDGQTPACPDAIIDLRVDNNRNGTVDLNDPTEDALESTWSDSHGAIFLANIDDDENACPTSGTDAQLAACHDANDTYINGTADLDDLARIKTVPWPNAPADAGGSINVATQDASHVRLFKYDGSSWNVYNSGAALSASELRNGVELAIEGLDIVRDTADWDGFVDLTLTVDAGTGPNGPLTGGSDMVRMRVAPVIFRHHVDELDTYYVTALSSQSSVDFRSDLEVAASAANVPNPVKNIYYGDQWTQDFFETAYMSMPTPGGQHVVHVNFRSANYTSSGLREAGRTVFTDLRGEDVAGAVQFDTGHPNSMDTLNSFGNTETIPPYGNWPLGRVLRGSHPQYYPDVSFDTMIDSQGVQDVFTVDTSWLLVGHVDETVSFIKTNSARGWAMLANDAVLAKTMFEDLQNQGYGNFTVFAGKFWSGGSSAQTTINNILGDPDIMAESLDSALHVDEQVDKIKTETGLQNSEIVPIPFLHWLSSGYSLAYQPGTVNGLYMGDDTFAPPDPHGPTINGSDPFQTQLEQALGAHGVNVVFIENWDLYHRLSGEVHCGSNATRKVPSNVKWWEMSQ